MRRQPLQQLYIINKSKILIEQFDYIAKGEFKLKYKEIKKYLYGDCIVRNEEYEYKVSKGDNIYCRQIGCETWNSIISIPDYEKEQEWELVGKK